jgi:hypothetical protein
VKDQGSGAALRARVGAAGWSASLGGRSQALDG